MKFQAERETLVDKLQKIQGITSKKMSMPILSHVLLDANAENGLVLSATDLDLSLKTSTGIIVEEPGKITVSARKLLEVVREVGHSSIQLTLTDSNRLLVKAGRSQFELATLPAEDFPYFNFAEDAAMVSFEAQVLRKAMLRTVFAVPPDDDAFSVPGLFCELQDSGQIRFIASDGHRLAYEQLELPRFEQLGLEQAITVPRKGVQEIIRILEKEDEVFLGLREDRLLVRTEDTILSTQLLEEEFPKYNAIIPDERPHHFLINREQFQLSLKRLSVVTDQTWKHVRFNVQGQSLELSSGNPELGQADDVIDIEYEGQEFSVSFNIRYVIDAVQLLDSETIRFEWLDAYHAGIFAEPDNDCYLSLIMPMVI